MVEHMRKCSKGVGDQVLVLDSAQVGMKTRAVAAAAAEEAGAEKRRKIGKGELRLPSPPLLQITKAEKDIRDPCATATAASFSCDHVPLSCCSNNVSPEELQFTDLEEIVEIEAVARYNLDTITSKTRSELTAGSDEQDTIPAKSSTVINSRRTVLPSEKMPPESELEEFFASAESDLHKRFKHKYNYDIMNDTPLEGRFQWIQVKP